MGIDISKTPSNCAYKICAFNIFYDVYSIFQLKRKKCNNKIHLSHKVFQACPCTDLPSLARKSILLFKLLFLLCGAGPPLPDSVEIGPGKRPPSRGGTMSLSAWLCSQFPPVWRQQLPHPTLPHTPAWTGLTSMEQRGRLLSPWLPCILLGSYPEVEWYFWATEEKKSTCNFSEGSFAIYLVSKPERNSWNQNC